MIPFMEYRKRQMPFMLLKDKAVVTLGGKMTARGHQGSFLGSCYVLFLDRGAGYSGYVQFVKIHPVVHF